MSAKEVIKAIKVKLILNKLSKAKEAAMRDFLGLPVKQSWTSECTTTVMTFIKDQILHIFCPCCIYDKNRQQKRLACLSSPYFKEFVGFISGLIMALLAYFILVFQMDVHPRHASIVCGIGSLALSLLLAFSLNIRCLVIMMVPQFFSGKGRMFLLMYALFLVMNHPVKNTFVNVTVMSQAATCGQEMALNETKDLIKAATAPLEGLMTNVKEVVKKLTEFSNSLRDTYMALSRTLREIDGGAMSGIISRYIPNISKGSTVATVSEWLMGITERCTEKFGSPYKQCIDAFMEGERKCRDELGLLKFMCKGITALDFLCQLAKVGQAFCFLVDIFKRFIVTPIDSGSRKVLKSVGDMFYFNVTIDYKFNYSISQSKSYTDIRKDITNEINSYMDSYVMLIGYLKNFLLLTIMFVLFKALIYRYRWLSNDRYDNTYITFTVLDLDERRKEKGKSGIMPLTYEEEMKYISDASSSMTRKEMISLGSGLVLFIFSAFNAGFYLFCDFGLYSVLKIIKQNFSKATKLPVPSHTKLHVVGKGPMADMYKSMVSMFDPVATSNVEIDVTPCVPNPSEPDWQVYRTIGIIYLLCLIMTIGEAYALRLRHMIMGCYFPGRERKRAIWLYNHIMKTRGGLLANARKAIKDRHEGSAVTDQISFKGRLAAMFPIFEKIFKFFGWEVKSCLYCGKEGKPDDYVRFIHCSFLDCDAIYCVDCYSDLDNICPVCNNAVDIGAPDDESVEIDSSIDERDRLKAAVQRKMRNDKIAALKAERTSSRVMNRFKSAFGGGEKPPIKRDNPSTTVNMPTGEHKQHKGREKDKSAINRPVNPTDGGKSPPKTAVNPSSRKKPDEKRKQQRAHDKKKGIADTQEKGKTPKGPRKTPKGPRNTNQNMRQTYSQLLSENEYNPVIQSRDVWDTRDSDTDQSSSDSTDYESTCPSSGDSDDLDYSYQYESPIVRRISRPKVGPRCVYVPRSRRALDLIPYDVYSSSDSISDESGGESTNYWLENWIEPVPSTIQRN